MFVDYIKGCNTQCGLEESHTVLQIVCILEEQFDEWKGNLEQLDDVCVIGVKF